MNGKINNRCGAIFQYAHPGEYQSALKSALESLGEKFGSSDFVDFNRVNGEVLHCWRSKHVGGHANRLGRLYIVWDEK